MTSARASTTTGGTGVIESSLLTRRLTLTLAAGTGIAAANLYYAQPLLHTIAERFGASSSSAGLVVTASQVGYALGLAFLVPAGDLLDRRRLVPRLMVLAGALPRLPRSRRRSGCSSVCWAWSARASWRRRSWCHSPLSWPPMANAARPSAR